MLCKGSDHLWRERVYLGTWQFGGQFRLMTREDIEDVIAFAVEIGITHFETAIAYGAGSVECLLGEVLPQSSHIATKVPAVRKPPLVNAEAPDFYYPRGWILNQMEASLSHLKRHRIDTVLLHNWSRDWQNNILPLEELAALKELGLVDRIGISLPNSFSTTLSPALLERLDVIEAPLNPEELWTASFLPDWKSRGKEVILRSLFLQGTLLMEPSAIASLPATDIRHTRHGLGKTGSAKSILLSTWRLGCSVAIGMTTKEQISENIATIQEACDEVGGCQPSQS